MKEYKIGNHGTCIIRSGSSGKIGDIEMEYGNQPYTILKDVGVTIHFEEKNSGAKAVGQELLYSTNLLKSVKLSNINLTDKILNLIYSKKSTALAHHIENVVSDSEKRIFFSTREPKYQIFIYDENSQLEHAYGSLEENSLVVNNSNSSYLVVYSCAKKGYQLVRPHYMYLSLDVQAEGNDEYDNKVVYWFHFHKCALRTRQELYLNNGTNTVDLEFEILHSDEDYVSIS